jgi:hypothetical protein
MLVNPLKVMQMSEGICESPCWMGITPLESSFGESLETVKGLKFLLPGGELRTDEERGNINWYSGARQNVYIIFENGYVSYIDAYSPDATLKDVIEEYGQPTFYITYSLEEEPEGVRVKFYEVDLFYPENGLVFIILADSPLYENIRVRDVYFVHQGTIMEMIEEFQLHRKANYPHYLIVEKEYYPWEGLGLCPQGLLSNEYCTQ